MNQKLKVLIVEDDIIDAGLAFKELSAAGIIYDGRRVDTAGDFRDALDSFKPNVILSDFSMPKFDGMQALKIAHQLVPEVPFIFVSGTIGEESAIQALRNGATDYVLKDKRLRLASAVERAVAEANERAMWALRENGRQSSANKHLDDVIASLHDVIWSVSVPAGDPIYVSPAVSQFYEHKPETFCEGGVPWGSILHPHDRPSFMADWARALETGTLDSRHRVVLGQGDTRWMHSRGSTVTDACGRVQRVNGISEDITHYQRKQQKVARLSRILVKVLRGVMAGNHRVSPGLVEMLESGFAGSRERLRHEQLSERELQTLLLIGNGRTVKQIAGELAISVNTVNTYRTRILKKMEMRTNAALIRYAVENGLVE